MTRNNGDPSAALQRPVRGPVRLLLDLFSSIWLGVTLLAMLFLYSSLDSIVLFIYWLFDIDGGPLLRQLPGIELTEFEWFHWWPFNLLIAMLAANLAITTIRRIPLKLINAGVWMIHTGILTLLTGSVWYFGTKVEGDAPVFRRRAVIQVPGAPEPATMLIRPGNQIAVGSGPNEYRFAVSNIFPDWSITSEADKGQKAYAVWIDVQTPTRNFTRQLMAGYPQYTEDILPNRQRAKEELGTALVDADLQMTLDFDPQEYFYVTDSAALYVRRAGDDEWTERPIPRPVRYNEYVASRDEVWLPSSERIPLRNLDIAVPSVASDDPLEQVDTRVTGFLPYALERTRWLDNGDRLNPLLSGSVQVQEGPANPFELMAFDPQRSTGLNGAVVFRWVENAEQLEAACADRPAQPASPPRLTVRIPGTEIRIEHEITDAAASNPSLDFTPIAGADYSFRVHNAINNLRIPSGAYEGRTISVAVVDIKAPSRSFTRWVADLPEITRDFAAESDPAGHQPIDLDAGIQMTYQPGSAGTSSEALLTIAAGPADIGIEASLNTPSGHRERHPVTIGQPLELANGELRLTIDSLATHAGRPDRRPEIVAHHQRNREAKDLFSMLKVELNDNGATRSLWLPFNAYAVANEQYNYPGRMFYAPREIRLSDGRSYELMFSRRRVKLPYPVALEDFSLDQHVGGYTGNAFTIRNYVSRLRFTDGNGWTDPMEIHVNGPTEFGGYWFFQSQWDPPNAQARSPGFSYTGLGVGNRNGVHVQLAGCAIAVTGMIFAFYVKPIIKRRRQQSVRAGLAETQRKTPQRKPLVRESVLAPTHAGIPSRDRNET